MTESAARLEGVSKRFPGVRALDDVSVAIAPGSVHALCGENGAGKSTLARILAGLYPPDAGRLVIFGRPVSFSGPDSALASGIGIVHQELALCENLSVAENLCLAALPSKRGFVLRDEMRRRARRMLAAIDAPIEIDLPISELAVGQQQMIQIAAAVGHHARIIVFDEPTSSLFQHEAEKLYALIGWLRAQTVTCVYVTHRMEEIFRLCDAVTVLRDGRHVATQSVSSVNQAALVQMMIGRPLKEYFPRRVGAEAGQELLRVDRLTSPGKFRNVSFSVRAGEVLGLAGLVGAGRSQVVQAVFGIDRPTGGTVSVQGRAVRIHGPEEAMRLGIGLVPEDRKRQGLVLPMSARNNTTLAALKAFARLNFINHRSEDETAQTYFERLRVRAPGLHCAAAGLSGGNQQKIVLAKWLAARCRILFLDEPTRGVDIGAKAEIHALIDELAAQGHGIIFISNELPELINLSTRIIVLRKGEIAGELPGERATQELLMRLMAGLAA